ncbi:MAG: lysophospholipid acyltransferase family protein [Maribacter sp.]|nr:lysophospholipid acyltransferase family protein [Maribacter sp.]
MLYNLVKFWIKTGLYLYYGRIYISGLENVPNDRPLLFLPNHQSALMDVLILAIASKRKPYFLTRSDVFKNALLNAIFRFFRMIPVYRIRDGREKLINNQAIFDRCSDLLGKGEAILMFPEASHSLKRQVRPITKGYTRILMRTMERRPDLDLRVVPIGLNYRNAQYFPNRVHINIGNYITVAYWYDVKDPVSSIQKIMNAVSEKLRTLTTDIPNNAGSYDEIAMRLDKLGVDYLKPHDVNTIIQNLKPTAIIEKVPEKSNFFTAFLKSLYWIVNLPVLLVWRWFIKPKVPEAEFLETFRFAYAMLVYPIYYVSLFALLNTLGSAFFAISCALGVLIVNWFYVRVA